MNSVFLFVDEKKMLFYAILFNKSALLSTK